MHSHMLTHSPPHTHMLTHTHTPSLVDSVLFHSALSPASFSLGTNLCSPSVNRSRSASLLFATESVCNTALAALELASRLSSPLGLCKGRGFHSDYNTLAPFPSPPEVLHPDPPDPAGTYKADCPRDSAGPASGTKIWGNLLSTEKPA